MLFLVFCNENFLHFLRIFIDLLVILDISLIYSAFFAIKNNNNFIFYQILRVCIGEALCKRVCIKVKRSVRMCVSGEYGNACGEFRFPVEKVTDRGKPDVM